jgi:hypothetical protein
MVADVWRYRSGGIAHVRIVSTRFGRHVIQIRRHRLAYTFNPMAYERAAGLTDWSTVKAKDIPELSVIFSQLQAEHA